MDFPWIFRNPESGIRNLASGKRWTRRIIGINDPSARPQTGWVAVASMGPAISIIIIMIALPDCSPTLLSHSALLDSSPRLLSPDCFPRLLSTDGSPRMLSPDCSPRLLPKIALRECSSRLVSPVALPDCSPRLRSPAQAPKIP